MKSVLFLVLNLMTSVSLAQNFVPPVGHGWDAFTPGYQAEILADAYSACVPTPKIRFGNQKLLRTTFTPVEGRGGKIEEWRVSYIFENSRFIDCKIPTLATDIQIKTIGYKLVPDKNNPKKTVKAPFKAEVANRDAIRIRALSLLENDYKVTPPVSTLPAVTYGIGSGFQGGDEPSAAQ